VRAKYTKVLYMINYILKLNFIKALSIFLLLLVINMPLRKFYYKESRRTVYCALSPLYGEV